MAHELTIVEAARIMERRFGRRMNFWFDRFKRRYYAGQFLDDTDEWATGPDGRVLLDEQGLPRPNHPSRRRQLIFGEGATAEEALRFLTGTRPTVGYRPHFDSRGSVATLRSPSGLLLTRIPAPEPDA